MSVNAMLGGKTRFALALSATCLAMATLAFGSVWLGQNAANGTVSPTWQLLSRVGLFGVWTAYVGWLFFRGHE